MTHPVLQGMLMTGCQKQQNILLAFHTYMELCEVKVMWDVEYSYEKELDILFLKAKPKKSSQDYDYFVPISSSYDITPGWLTKVRNIIVGQNSNSSFTLVIKDRDSSSVYYKVSEGLVPPLSPEATKRKKSLEEKQRYLQSELKKRRTQLFDEAKNKFNAALLSSGDTVNPVSDNSENNSDKITDPSCSVSDAITNSSKSTIIEEAILVEDNDNDMAVEIIEL